MGAETQVILGKCMANELARLDTTLKQNGA